MSDANPIEVYRRYQRKELDKAAAVGYLKSFIESSSDEELRVQSVEFLGKINFEVGIIFEFFEHLVTSDKSENVRIAAVKEKEMLTNEI
jgi:HEAT repeat protein